MASAKTQVYLFWLTVLGLGGVSCATLVEKPVATEDLQVQLIRGEQVSIEITSPEAVKAETALIIAEPPLNGVLRADHVLGALEYQHGGANRVEDAFVVKWRDPSGTLYSKAVKLEFRDRIARVVLIAPRNKSVYRAGDIQVKYQTQGEDFNHLHIALDNQGHNTIRDLTGSFTLQNVPIGEHIVSATLVDKNHNSIGGADAESVVRITVLP